MPSKNRVNGDGCYTKLVNKNTGETKYKYRKSVTNPDTGETKEISGTDVTKPKAYNRFEKNKEKFLGDSLNNNVKTMTVAQMCNKYLEYCKQQPEKLKDSSYNRNDGIIRNHIEKHSIGLKRVELISSKEILDHINSLAKMGLSYSSLKKVWDVLNSSFKWMVKQGLINFNPCDAVSETVRNNLKNIRNKEKNITKSVITTDIDKLQDIKNEIFALCQDESISDEDKRLLLAMLFFLETGLRSGEGCFLKFKHIREQDSKVILEVAGSRRRDRKDGKNIVHEIAVKTNKTRYIELSSDAIRVIDIMKNLRTVVDDEDYLFINSKGNPYNSTTLVNGLGKAYSLLGLNGFSGAHILRRTYATIAFKRGVSVDNIATYIGDTPETVRKHYIESKDIVIDYDGNVFAYVKLP